MKTVYVITVVEDEQSVTLRGQQTAPMRWLTASLVKQVSMLLEEAGHNECDRPQTTH